MFLKTIILISLTVQYTVNGYSYYPNYNYNNYGNNQPANVPVENSYNQYPLDPSNYRSARGYYPYPVPVANNVRNDQAYPASGIPPTRPPCNKKDPRCALKMYDENGYYTKEYLEQPIGQYVMNTPIPQEVLEALEQYHKDPASFKATNIRSPPYQPPASTPYPPRPSQ